MPKKQKRTSEPASRIAPNSTPYPHYYLRTLQPLLAPDETAALNVFVDNIFGWVEHRRKNRDRVAVSQVAYGANLSVDRARKVTAYLVKIGVLVRYDNNNALNQGPLYGLQLDDQKIDLASLELRQSERARLFGQRMNKLRALRGTPVPQEHPPLVSQEACTPVPQETPKRLLKKSPKEKTSRGGEKMPTDQSYKNGQKDIVDAILEQQAEAERRAAVGEHALEWAPEHLQPYIRKFCQLWSIDPPGNTKEQKSWLDSTEQVRQKCAELGTSVLADVFNKWSREGRRLTIATPRSVINLCGAAAGIRRSTRRNVAVPETAENEDKALFAQGQKI